MYTADTSVTILEENIKKNQSVVFKITKISLWFKNVVIAKLYKTEMVEIKMCI